MKLDRQTFLRGDGVASAGRHDEARCRCCDGGQLTHGLHQLAGFCNNLLLDQCAT